MGIHTNIHTYVHSYMRRERNLFVAGKKSIVEIQYLKSRKSDEKSKSPLNNKHGNN